MKIEAQQDGIRLAYIATITITNENNFKTLILVYYARHANKISEKENEWSTRAYKNIDTYEEKMAIICLITNFYFTDNGKSIRDTKPRKARRFCNSPIERPEGDDDYLARARRCRNRREMHLN